MNKLLIEVTNMDTLHREVYYFSAENHNRRNACMRSGLVHCFTPDQCKFNTIYVADGRKWHVYEMTDAQRRQRANIRNFLCAATLDELRKDRATRTGDSFAIHCVNELIDEAENEQERTEFESRLRRGLLTEEHPHTGDKP